MLLQDLNTLTSRFTSRWTGTLPIVYDLAPQKDYPNGKVSFSVVLTSSRHLYGDVTSGAKRQNGFVELNIDIPDEHGDGDAIDMMEQFATIFRNYSDGVVNCQTEYVTPKMKLQSGLIRFRISVSFYSVRSYKS
jgi:hypothetical protein